jgi:hypothetical protein
MAYMMCVWKVEVESDSGRLVGCGTSESLTLGLFYSTSSCRCCGWRCARPYGNVILLSNAGEIGEVALAGFVIWRSRAHTQLLHGGGQHMLMLTTPSSVCRVGAATTRAYATVSRDVR